MRVVVGLDLVVLSMLYGYCLAAQPRYATPGAKRVSAWTFRQPLLVRCVVAFAVWQVFLWGIYLLSGWH